MANKTLYKQCVLKSGTSVLVCWLEADKVKQGTRVTLEDSANPTQWWTVISASGLSMAREEIKDAHTSKNWYKKDFHGELKGLIVD